MSRREYFRACNKNFRKPRFFSDAPSIVSNGNKCEIKLWRLYSTRCN